MYVRLSVCVCIMCVQIKVKIRYQIPGAKVIGIALCKCWKANTSPLEVQQKAFLTTKPSLQSRFYCM